MQQLSWPFDTRRCITRKCNTAGESDTAAGATARVDNQRGQDDIYNITEIQLPDNVVFT